MDNASNNTAVESGQAKSYRRVRVYVDGFNLYHAIAEMKDPRLKWLNFWTLGQTFIRSGEILDEVNLFTAVLTWNQAKQQRHKNFLAACKAVGVQVHEAKFKKTFKRCAAFERDCKFQEEKQTDVAIAVQMVSDALQGQIDRAILITADSDQIPSARFVSQLPGIEMSIVFPPGRKHLARELGETSSRAPIELAPGRLLTCMLPRSVVDASGKNVASMPAVYQIAQNSN